MFQTNLGNKLVIVILLLSTFLSIKKSYAEGSVNFIYYSGYRLFFDAEQQQQLKVYAGRGEYINVGASHVGIDGGYIEVYRPNGTLHSTFDNTGATEGLAIIQNNIEELNGPSGGGSSNGEGYIPGVVRVKTGEDGIWTIIIKFSTSKPLNNFPNLLNNEAWTRADQPTERRVVLAWDITVSRYAAGNDGGFLQTGRVYSNHYISMISLLNNPSSPTFYVLTKEGYQYQVDFSDLDPWGFPIFSNTWGIVDGNLQPTYASHYQNDVELVDLLTDLDPNKKYLYNPQALDHPRVVNNKLFFTIPDDRLPESAMVTDIYANYTHTTWLYQKPLPPILEVTDFNIVPSNEDIELPEEIIQIDKGAYFKFVSSLSGTVKLSIDIDQNGSYTDPIDWVYYERIEPGRDSVFWPVTNGFGQLLQAELKLEVFYKLEMYGGELHILMSDVENNGGGVSFTRINGENAPQRFHFYDHTNVDGTVSGGGIPGNALQTSIPYTFDNLWGDDKLLDYWSYVAFLEDEGVYIVNLVTDYDDFCSNMNQASLKAVEPSVCNDKVITLYLEAVDTNWMIADTDPVYIWLNANDDTLHTGMDTSFSFNSNDVLAISPYKIIATNFACSSPVSEPVEVDITTSLDSLHIVSIDTICPNQSFQLTTQSIIGTIYEWRIRGDTTILSHEQNPVFENYANTTTFELSIITQQCVPNPIVDYTIFVKTPPDAPKPRDRMLQHCEGEEATLFIETGPGAVFKWYFESSNNQIGLGLSPFLEIDNLSPSNAGVYWFTSTVDACESALSDSIFLVVDTIPANQSVAGLDIDQCGSSIAKLDAVIPSVGTGFWTSPTGATVANPDLADTDVAELSVGDNLFIWTLSNGACKDYELDSMNINVSFISTDIADAGVDIAICLDGTTKLDALPLGSATGLWTQSEEQKNAGIKILDPTNSDTDISGMQTNSNYTFTWTLSEANCLDFSKDSVKVQIDEIPDESAFLPDDALTTCNDEGVAILAIEPTKSTGRWANYSGASIANSNSASTFVNNMEPGNNYFTWLLSNGACVDFDSVLLSVYKEQAPLSITDEYSLSFGEKLKGENVLDNDEFFEINDWNLTLLQTTQSGTLVLNIDGTFIYTPEEGFSGDDYFIYEICNENCADLCSSARVEIEVLEPIVVPIPCLIPEAITPNGDHANDVFDIPCLNQYPNNNIKIFNRWGKKVYEADNYQNNWAGTYKGKVLPTGTYFYIIKTKADLEEYFQGYFMIVQ